MGDDKENVLIDSEEDNKFVSLPVSKEEFKGFISNLLGQPQKISGYINGSFEIKKENLCSIFYAINQRITQQNDASLAKFSIKITYDNNTQITLTDIVDFESYHEYQPVVTKAVHINFGYLIKFNNKSIPELQEINISISSGDDSDFPFFENEDNLIIPIIFMFGLFEGNIHYHISHTDRTWGMDIQSLLSSSFQQIIKKPTKIRRFIFKYSSKIGTIVAFILLMVTVATIIYISNEIQDKNYIEITKMMENKTPIEKFITTSNQYTLDAVSSGYWEMFYFQSIAFLLFVTLTALTIRKTIARLGRIVKPGVILLTSKDEETLGKIYDNLKTKWINFSISIAGTIITGLAANFIFAYLWSG